MASKCISTLHSKVRYSERVGYRESMKKTLKKVLKYGIRLEDVPKRYTKERKYLKRNKVYFQGKIYVFAKQNQYHTLLTVYPYHSEVLESLYQSKDRERKEKYYKQFFTSQRKVLYRISLYKNRIYEVKVVSKREYTLELLEDKRYRRNISKHFTKLLNGRQPYWNIPLYLEEIDPFEKSIYKRVLEIKRGETITYKELANEFKITVQKLSRILKKCPIPILIPTHRVIKTNKQVGCHTVSKDLKKHILRLEIINVEKESKVKKKVVVNSKEETENDYLCYNLSELLQGLV